MLKICILLGLFICEVSTFLFTPYYNPPDIIEYVDKSCPYDNNKKYYLDVEDTTIITNALHYYKKVDKKGKFQKYSVDRINKLRDKIVNQQLDDNIEESCETTIFPPMQNLHKK